VLIMIQKVFPHGISAFVGKCYLLFVTIYYVEQNIRWFVLNSPSVRPAEIFICFQAQNMAFLYVT
jgi:hypothetical protein